MVQFFRVVHGWLVLKGFAFGERENVAARARVSDRLSLPQR